MGQASGVLVGVSAAGAVCGARERPGVSALQITLSWGETVLRTVYLSPPRDFTIGEACGPGEAAGWIVPHRVLGTEQWRLVTCRGDEVTLRVPARACAVTPEGAGRAATSPVLVPSVHPSDASEDSVRRVRLDDGSAACLELGDFTLRLAHVAAVRRPPRTFGSWLDRPMMLAFTLTGGALAALLAVLAWSQPAGGLVADETDLNHVRLVQQYLSAAGERELEALRSGEREAEPAPQRPRGLFGERAKAKEGKLGGSVSRAEPGRVGVKGVPAQPDPHLARIAALQEAQEFGVIEQLDRVGRGDPDAPSASWGRLTSAGRDPRSARGNLWDEEIGTTYGGGLGLSGIGRGGGGRGEGIGLGTVAPMGRCCGPVSGSGFGRGLGSPRRPAPRVRTQAPSVSGQLPATIVQRIASQSQSQLQRCYAQGLARQPALVGQVSVRFVIDREGHVSHATCGGADLPNAAVIRCVVATFYGLSFPRPPGGVVTVSYPLRFGPS